MRQDDIGSQGVIAGLRRERESDLGVFQCFVESLEDPDAGRRNPFVGDRERLAIVPGLVDDLRKSVLASSGCS